jgi:hypothetical protein
VSISTNAENGAKKGRTIMPNWCANKLTVTGSVEEVQAFKAKAVGHPPWSEPEGPPDVLNFHSLVPLPVEVLTTGTPSNNEAAYQWQLANWGCKWGACDAGIVDECESCLVYAFNTAWSPPIPFIQTVAKQWPGLIFVLEYEESGMGFKGLAKFQGEMSEDHCVSL